MEKSKKGSGERRIYVFFFSFTHSLEDSEVEDDFYSFDECDQSGLLNDDNGNLFFRLHS